MDVKRKHWSVEETYCLLAQWSSTKVQNKQPGASRTRLEQVQREMAAAGYHRNVEQIVNKLKKLKMGYRHRKNSQGGSGRGRPRKNTSFDLLDSVLGGGPAACLLTGALDTAAGMLETVVGDMPLQNFSGNDSPTVVDMPGGSTTPDHLLPFTMSDHSPPFSMSDHVLPFTMPDHLLPFTMSDPTSGPTESPEESSFFLIQLDDSDLPSTSSAVTSAAVQTSAKDAPVCSWSKGEVQALLTLWANPAVQQELRLNVRNNQVYNRLSAKLASLGFNKTPQKCKEKIKKLKQDYKRIKNSIKSNQRKGGSSVWFSIMDEVLTSPAPAVRHSETPELSLPTLSDVLDVETDDETQWLPDEVQVLMTLWAQSNIQRQLRSAAAGNVFTYLSNELALVGFNKTPRQCCRKVNNLIEEYKKIKQEEPNGEVEGDWFSILDGVVGSRGVERPSAPPKEPTSMDDERVNADASRAAWTSHEVKVLLARWAEESIQQQLRATPRNNIVFAQLSSELATQGYDKTTNQCRIKINQLKEKYRRTMREQRNHHQRKTWFAIMDEVLGRYEPAAKKAAAKVPHPVAAPLQASQQDLPHAGEARRLSVSSLCLLVPTLRLMCAFAWQAVQCCNVAHYGKVLELVEVVTELAPELLTPREKAQLLLRLRARLVLELFLSESSANLLSVQRHVKAIQDLRMSSSCDQEELEEFENSKSNFAEVVDTLLEDSEERKRFFKDVFPVYYGQKYEVILHTLVWKLISRLDNLLPVPDIKQTAEWLSTTPSVMEQCGELVLEPDQLKALLHFHQQQSENANKCYTRAQFLPTLTLHPRANSRQQEVSADDEDDEQFDCSEDEEQIEDRMDDEATREVGSDGDEEPKWTDEQSDAMTTANCWNLNHAPLQLQTGSLHVDSDSRASGLVKHEPPFQESVYSLREEPGSDGVPRDVTTRTATDTWESTCENLFEDVATLSGLIKPRTAPFHCDKCDKKYASRDSLIVHGRIHTGETPYLCPHCGQGFRSSGMLGLHVRIHTGDRRYKCHVCGKTSIQHLMRHMRMHRGEKNYLCTVCGKAFLSSGELRLHTRIHTGERPYACKQCGKGFIAKCHLTVHMRQHTGESPYRCSVCPKSFSTLRAQRRHLTIHSNKKSFQCLKCGKIFRQEDIFKMHVETHMM
ncbi:uncharacterized protein [Embiotoca jacksoni]|uniref:uncharacterized protein isoform X1 n=1 Tax=Embiotoca jacksoni TaxID=100190 RepID=UPI0037037A48